MIIDRIDTESPDQKDLFKSSTTQGWKA
jgi:hypothetical protein